MKKALCLILTCLLLVGCAAQPDVDVTAPTAVQTVPSETEPMRLYVPEHPLEQSAPGALRVYPLRQQAGGILAMGSDLIVLCGSDTTVLTLLTGEDLVVGATAELSFRLDENDPSLRVGRDALSYFDPVRRETVILSDTLKDVSRIAAPEGMVGSPILSADRSTLYYCTPTAIRAWDLETGIRRCVKELSYESQELTGLHQEDTILQCLITQDGEERTLFLAADTGRLLWEVPGDVTLKTQGSGYYASVPEGPVRLQLFGQSGDAQLLTPGDIYADCYYLENQRRVVAVSGQEIPVLNCYELDTGLRCASLTLDGNYEFVSITACEADAVYLLLKDRDGDGLICRWDLYAEASRTADTRSYAGPRYTEGAPDSAALAQCQEDAAQLGEKYGIQVLVWQDPLTVMPWDYEFEPEYLAPVLSRELSELDQRLSYYPPEILAGIKEHFSDLTICLVRDIQGSPESGSLAKATGIQFYQGSHAYIAIAVGQYAERALYHELYHVMETRLLTDSTALDRWDAMNPAGFAYDLDYAANQSRKADEYLQPDTRSFIDTYSMSFPKEDRARIMECAMSAGNEALFRSPVMQAKLGCLATAIREAYGLKKSTENFRWEQYLK
ncbi:MAG: hypothetical protein Q4F81_04180 [Eubacteriales bacterium]|nr:hypothetical protein [Eubacteriales bacterium]